MSILIDLNGPFLPTIFILALWTCFRFVFDNGEFLYGKQLLVDKACGPVANTTWCNLA